MRPVVRRPLFLIPQNLVSFVDFLHALNGVRVRIAVRMILPRPLAKGGANLLETGVFTNAQNLVIGSVLGGHWGGLQSVSQGETFGSESGA